jgi:dipeptidyl aminopeptidase/acylaminoacyl peptidase
MAGSRYTPEMAADLRMPHEPRIAPNGQNLAFRVEPIGHRTKDRTSAIFVTDLDGSGSLRPITGNDEYNTSPCWSPDSTSIAFLSDRSERGTSQLYAVPSSGGEALRLTDLTGGVGNIAWIPDGRSLLFTARRKSLRGESDAGEEIKVASKRRRPQVIARVANSGGPPSVIGPKKGHVWSFALSTDGQRIAAVVSDTEDLSDLWDNVRLIDFSVHGGDERELLRLTGFPNRPCWSEDGRFICVLGSRLQHADDTNVFVVDVDTGTATILDDRGMTPTWAVFQAENLLILSVEEQQTRIDVTDVAGAEWETLSLGPTADSGWIDSAPNIDSRDGMLAFVLSQPQQTPDIHVTSSGTTRQLTDLNPHLDNVILADMEPVTWKSVDGVTVHGWVMLPPHLDATGPLPLITAIHGGPSWQWGNWFHGTWHDWGQILAANGYAVFMPNPRGSTGRGGSFTGSNRFDFGGGDYSDIMSGIDMLLDRGVADPDRLGICGWSYGGFMTAWAVTQTDRFKAAVAGAAPTNWVSKIGTTDIRPFNEWSLGSVNDEPDQVWERSPIRYVKRVSTPTLMVHGEADPRVPVTQGTEFYSALKALGVETEMVSYPRQGHAFHERAFQIDLLQRLLDWFECYLRTEPALGSVSAEVTNASN